MQHVIKLGSRYFGRNGQLTDRQTEAQRFDLGPAFTGESADLGPRYPRLVRLRPRNTVADDDGPRTTVDDSLVAGGSLSVADAIGPVDPERER